MRSTDALRVSAAGEALWLLPPGVVWWEASRTLLAADLHVGMSETLQAAGMGVPTGRHEQDLEDLATLAQGRRASRLIVLGDFFHASSGITDDVFQMVARWRSALDVPVWLALGNHDAPLRKRGGELPFDRVEDGFLEGPFLFTHLPGEAPGAAPSEAPFRVCGHLHPVVRLEGGRDRLRLRCFVADADQLILPSFGRMTGGAPVDAKRGRRRYPVTADEVLDLGI